MPYDFYGPQDPFALHAAGDSPADHDRDDADGRIIRRHYGLTRAVTAEEVAAELADLRRKAAAGTLDDSQERLYAALNLSHRDA